MGRGGRPRPRRDGVVVSVHDGIVDALGGARALRLMVAADSFAGDETSLSFRFKGSRKASVVRVELTPLDVYRVRFVRGSRLVAEYEDVYGEDLATIFERVTGLCLTVPRIFRCAS